MRLRLVPSLLYFIRYQSDVNHHERDRFQKVSTTHSDQSFSCHRLYAAPERSISHLTRKICHSVYGNYELRDEKQKADLCKDLRCDRARNGCSDLDYLLSDIPPSAALLTPLISCPHSVLIEAEMFSNSLLVQNSTLLSVTQNGQVRYELKTPYRVFSS